jgi:predicted nucleic acid-binding protein
MTLRYVKSELLENLRRRDQRATGRDGCQVGARTVGLLIPLKLVDANALAPILGRAEALAVNRDANLDDEALAAFGEADPVNWSEKAVGARKRPELLEIVDALASIMTVVPVSALAPMLADAERALLQAPASANRSTRDAHVLALAWEIDADIWTTNRDFAGAGVATSSTPNLVRAITGK